MSVDITSASFDATNTKVLASASSAAGPPTFTLRCFNGAAFITDQAPTATSSEIGTDIHHAEFAKHEMADNYRVRADIQGSKPDEVAVPHP